MRPCGAYIATTEEVAEAEKNPNDISTLYGVDINRGLEGCLSLTVKKESLGEYYIFSDLNARMIKYKVNIWSVRFQKENEYGGGR